MENIDPKKVPCMFRIDFELLWDTEPTQATESDRQIIDVFGDDLLSPSSKPATLETTSRPKSDGVKRIQSQILAEMIAIDKERALTSMKAWAVFIQLSTSRQRSQPFASLEEYLPYRIIDAGEMWVAQRKN